MSSHAITKMTHSFFCGAIEQSITTEDLINFAVKKYAILLFQKDLEKLMQVVQKNTLPFSYRPYNLTSTNYYCLVSSIYENKKEKLHFMVVLNVLKLDKRCS